MIVERVGAVHMAMVRAYCESLWGRRSTAFYEWRFLHPSSPLSWIAIVDGRCGALISAMPKRYRLQGRIIDVHEIFDWSSAGEFRGRGLGVAVLRAVLQLGIPTFTLGGSDDTKRILPRMGWTALAEGQTFALPLRGTFIADRLRNRGAWSATVAKAAFDVFGRAWFRAARGRAARGLAVTPVTEFTRSSIEGSYAGDHSRDLVAPLDLEVLAWADRGLARPGQYLRFEAHEKASLAAFGLARVVENKGRRWGEIVEVFAADPDHRRYAALIRAMTATLSGFDIDAVLTTATCPQVRAALRMNHFLAGPTHPWLAWFPGGPPAIEKPVHAMRGTADHLYFPISSDGPAN
jgi:hypothetical protein